MTHSPIDSQEPPTGSTLPAMKGRNNFFSSSLGAFCPGALCLVSSETYSV